MKKFAFLTEIFFLSIHLFAQDKPLDKFAFLFGEWQGTGSGFNNSTSVINAQYQPVMNQTYIRIEHESKFKPTSRNPEGEQHSDWGMISYDKQRKKYVYRQFNIEGFVNQYVLNDSLSNDTLFIFETENIENFVKGGRARWTIKKLSQNNIETVFDVFFPGKDFVCMGINNMSRSVSKSD